jgi:hypothetical protein
VYFVLKSIFVFVVSPHYGSEYAQALRKVKVKLSLAYIALIALRGCGFQDL